MLDKSSTPQPVSALERERVVITGLLALLLLSWLGFAVHRGPQFPGSFAGTLLGIAGAVLMVLPSLTYTAVKRFAGLKQRLSERMPLRRLLTWHLWGGILGALLAIVHTAHRFDSLLGNALAGNVLLVVLSGYVGRHFLGKVSIQLREKQALLETLMAAYNVIAAEIAARPQEASSLSPSGRWGRRLGFGRWLPHTETYDTARRAAELTRSIADLEYGIKTDELMKQRFRIWLWVHIATSMAFYGLLSLHIWSSVYFGLRWLA